jgi:hypothetical protein
MRMLAVGLLATAAMLPQSVRRASAISEEAALRALSKTAPRVQWDKASMIVGDITCDGRPDTVFFGHSEGRISVGLFRASTGKAQVLQFRVGAAFQDAICREPAHLGLESLNYEMDSPVEGFQKSDRCKGLILDDDACDPLHFFWNHTTRELNWWRN